MLLQALSCNCSDPSCRPGCERTTIRVHSNTVVPLGAFRRQTSTETFQVDLFYM